MTKHKVVSTKKTTITITLNDDQVAEILIKSMSAPDTASVEFDCGYEFLREARISWTETEESEEEKKL